MQVTQRSRYALRALYEIARRDSHLPVRSTEIARTQAIPSKFLEAILRELRNAGFIESRRGREGGYLLARPAADISVGDILRCIQGPLTPVECIDGRSSDRCPLKAECVFMPMWEDAMRAVSKVYDATSLKDLADRSASMACGAADYSI